MSKRWLSRLYGALPAVIRARLPYSKTYRRIVASPDRVILVGEILPAFAAFGGGLLWVGVRRYTETYPEILEAKGAQVWTADIDPDNAVWGQNGRHITADLLQIDKHFRAGQFSGLLCNGVFGFGVDTIETQTTALRSMAEVMAPGGWLLLGWNTDRTADPLANPAFARWFEPGSLEGLPARRAVAGTTHVYDLARRRPGA